MLPRSRHDRPGDDPFAGIATERAETRAPSRPRAELFHGVGVGVARVCEPDGFDVIVTTASAGPATRLALREAEVDVVTA